MPMPSPSLPPGASQVPVQALLLDSKLVVSSAHAFATCHGINQPPPSFIEPLTAPFHTGGQQVPVPTI